MDSIERLSNSQTSECAKTFASAEELKTAASLKPLLPPYLESNGKYFIRVAFIDEHCKGMTKEFGETGHHLTIPLPKSYFPYAKQAAKDWGDACNNLIEFKFVSSNAAEVDVYLGLEDATTAADGMGATFYSKQRPLYILLNVQQIEQELKRLQKPIVGIGTHLMPNDSFQKLLLHIFSHEFGHVLGFYHPFETPSLRDKFLKVSHSQRCSVMNYPSKIKRADHYQTTLSDYHPSPGPFDANACQRIYAHNKNHTFFVRSPHLNLGQLQLTTPNSMSVHQDPPLRALTVIAFFLPLALLFLLLVKHGYRKGKAPSPGLNTAPKA